MKEIWKDVVGYEGYFMVSSIGRVKSVERSYVCANKWGTKNHTNLRSRIKKSFSRNGYPCVVLNRDNKQIKYNIHRLVAIAFIDNEDDLPCVNHIDGNKLNSSYINLEWCTNRQNQDHATMTGLKAKGEKLSFFTENDILKIRKMYEDNPKLTEIGKKFGTSPQTIQNIVKRKNWKHI